VSGQLNSKVALTLGKELLAPTE